MTKDVLYTATHKKKETGPSEMNSNRPYIKLRAVRVHVLPYFFLLIQVLRKGAVLQAC